MPHAPEELAQLSTLVHNVLGVLLLVLSVVLLVEIVRGAPAGRARFAWPTLGMAIGFGLTTWVFVHQIVDHELGPFDDPIQNQHQAIGMLAGLGSAAELWRRAGGGSGFTYGFPTALVGIGVAFLVHEQHALEALIVHWALAATLITAGFAWIAALASGEEARAMRLLGGLFLVAAAVQLAVYEESPGAHAPTPSGEHAGH